MTADNANSYRGKRVLITGASQGIGESLAHAFASAPSNRGALGPHREPLQTLAAELEGTAHPVDLSDRTQVATLVQRVEDEGGPSTSW
jgi:short-subunit dehydrogenase